MSDETPNVPEWRVYYDDGTTEDSHSTAPEDVRARGVLAIVQPDDEVGRVVIAGHDYYVYREDGDWYGMQELFGLWDYLAAPGYKKVLFGRTVPGDEYRKTYQRAIDDPDFPRKSAWKGMHDQREQERERPSGLQLDGGD